MGPQPILWFSYWLVAAGLFLPATAEADPAAIVDLRSDSARAVPSRDDAFVAALGPEIELTADTELAAALAGTKHHPSVDRGRSLAEAAKKRSAVACDNAVQLAERAIVELAAGRAAGVAVDEGLTSSYSTLLICAGKSGDVDGAMAARRSLQGLGVTSRPPGVPPNTWDRFPLLDAAANVMMASLTVDSSAPGAEVWIDHHLVGNAPVTALVRQGPHVVAVFREHSAVARSVEVSAWQQTEKIALARRTPRFGSHRALVDDWREAGRTTPAKVAALMIRLDVDILIARGENDATIWTIPPGAKHARALATVTTGKEANDIIVSSAHKWRGPGIAPRQPLLRESDDERLSYYGDDDSNEGQEWWVYASILGAVGVAAGVVLINEVRDNTQRIEVTIP